MREEEIPALMETFAVAGFELSGQRVGFENHKPNLLKEHISKQPMISDKCNVWVSVAKSRCVNPKT